MTPVSRDALVRVGKLLTDSAGEETEEESILQDVQRAAENPANVLGHYVLLSEVGRGGAGTVYRAYDRTLRRTVAVKVIGISGLEEGQVQALRNEFVAMARLRHPNIVSVFDSGRAGNRLFCVMEWMEGRSLHEAVSRRPWSVRRGVEIVRDIAGALETAHRQGFLHMDVKPANILLSNDVPKLADFSAGRRLFPPAEGASDPVRGTPGYMAPEQLTARSTSLDQRTDVFGLGMTLYALLTGSLLSLPSSPSIGDRGLRRIIGRATQRDPALRYPSAAELKADLSAWLARRPWKRWTLAAAALLTVGVGTAVWRYRPAARADRLEKKVETLVAEKHWETAWGMCRKAVELDPDRPSLRSMEALIALEVGEYEIASTYYADRLRRDPGNIEWNRAYLRASIGLRFRTTRFHLADHRRIDQIVEGDGIRACAETLAKAGDPVGRFVRKLGTTEHTKACEAFTENAEDLSYEFLILRAIERLHCGTIDGGRADLISARNRRPGRREVGILSAMVQLTFGTPDEVLAVARNVEGPDARRFEAMAHLLRGDPDTAIGILGGLGDDLPETWADLAICWYEKGHLDLARQLLERCLRAPDSYESLQYLVGYYLIRIDLRQGRIGAALERAGSLLQRSKATAKLEEEPLDPLPLRVRLSDTFWNFPQDWIEVNDVLPALRDHPEYGRKLGRHLRPRNRKSLAEKRTDHAELQYAPTQSASAQNPLFGADSKTIVFLRFEGGLDIAPANLPRLCSGSKGAFPLPKGLEPFDLRPGMSWNAATGRIAYSLDVNGRTGITTIAWDGSLEFRVPNLEGPQACLEPSFSPEGRWIVFARVDGEEGSLWKIRADGCELAPLTSGFDDRRPAWSPLGDRIVFQRRRRGGAHWDLVTIKPDGRDALPVTSSPGNERDPAWSPDGKWIVFSSDEKGRANLYVVPLTGGEWKQVTQSDASDEAPCWSPDGRWIAFQSRSGNDAGAPTSIWKTAAPDVVSEEPLDPSTLEIHDRGGSDPPPIDQVRSWAIQTNNLHLQRSAQALVDSRYDLVVVAHLRSTDAMKDFREKSWVDTLKSSAAREGRRKIVIAYLGVAEAISTLAYWRKEWRVGTPSFLAAPNKNWTESFHVRFWDPAWKRIVFESIDRNLADGFDGVYLNLAGYDYDEVQKAAVEDKKDVKPEMARFVKEISSKSKARNRGFLILAAGAEGLGGHADYVGAIDGHVQEGVWFRGDWKDGIGDLPTPAEETRNLIQELDLVKGSGKRIFTIDFASIPTHVSKACAEAASRGYVPTATTIGLDSLSASPPPGY